MTESEAINLMLHMGKLMADRGELPFFDEEEAVAAFEDTCGALNKEGIEIDYEAVCDEVLDPKGWC